ncbi:MAG: ferredoxin [Burkholderiales bacterium]|nr:MAG: ferredoxin [Burkholderiales bacterium]
MSGGAVRIVVDEHRCVGAGQCAWVAPKVFDQRAADGVVVLLQPRPGPDELPYAREAAQLCPARAIRIEDDPHEDDPHGDAP